MKPSAAHPATINPQDGKLGLAAVRDPVQPGEHLVLRPRPVPDPYLVCAFFSVECPGCSTDLEFWGDLSAEAAERKVGFYLISLDTDQDRVEKFTRAYGLQDLPVYLDPADQTARVFKVGVVPQYLLVRADGLIAGRWDGVRRYEGKQEDFDKVLRLFEPTRESSPGELTTYHF